MKTKHERFIAKRVLIFFLVLAILDMVFIRDRDRWAALLGLAAGGALSLLRFAQIVSLFSTLIPGQPDYPGQQVVPASNQPPPVPARNKSKAVKAGIAKYAVGQFIVVIMMFAAIKLGLWLFMGFIAGILLVSLVVLVNGITEGLGITHNHFE